jgi:hypothetical protein
MAKLDRLKPGPKMPRDTTAYRRRYLQQLADANGKWVDVVKIDSMYRMQKMVTSWLVKIGFIETREIVVGVGLGLNKITYRLEARILPRGRVGLATNKLTYHDNQIPIEIPREIFEGLGEIAGELNIVRDTGTSVGKASITGLLRHIVGRREAFVRWFRHINAENE